MKTNIYLGENEIFNLDSEGLKNFIVRLRFKNYMDCYFLYFLECSEEQKTFESRLGQDISYNLQYPILYLKKRAIELKNLRIQIQDFIKAKNLIKLHATWENYFNQPEENIFDSQYPLPFLEKQSLALEKLQTQILNFKKPQMKVVK